VHIVVDIVVVSTVVVVSVVAARTVVVVVSIVVVKIDSIVDHIAVVCNLVVHIVVDLLEKPLE
jgi:hypothetical protein